MQMEHSTWHMLNAGNVPVAVIISNRSQPQFPLSYNAIQAPPSQGYCEAEAEGLNAMRSANRSGRGCGRRLLL